MAKYSQLAFVFPAATVAGWLIGVALDRWLHTTWLYHRGTDRGHHCRLRRVDPGCACPRNPNDGSPMTTAEPFSSKPLTTDPNSEAFYSGALDRISRFMLVLAVGLSAAAWWHYGWRIAWDSPAEAPSPT